MPQIDLLDGPIWYAEHRQESGHPPLILIHGAGGSHLDWPGGLRRLEGIRVIVPDLPGHGRSAASGRRTVADYAADIAGLLAAMGIERGIIGGHSMGGAVAMTMALHYPERVAGLILIGTGAKLRVHPDILANALTDPDRVLDLITQWMWAEQIPDVVRQAGRQRMAATSPRIMSGDFEACNAFDVLSDLTRIAVPTLIIGGTDDRMTPLKFSLTLAEQIPGAELVTVAGGGHMMMLEQPHVVVRAVADWLGMAFEE